MIGTLPVLSYLQAEEALEKIKKEEKSFLISLDLNRTKDQVFVNEDGIVLPDSQLLNINDLKKIAKDKNKCYLVLEGKAYPIIIFSEKTGWVRTLQPTQTIPTSNVAGFIMHRIKDIDPLKDTLLKIKYLKINKKSVVLDTCMGLGYTAIESAKKAYKVVSVEVDPAALKIAKVNPWSQELFNFKNIEIRIGNLASEIKNFKDNSFTHIIHDPPNIRLAGELYSTQLYKEFFRVLRYKGTLFHYVGNPEKKQGNSITISVMKRLKEAGFKKIKRLPSAFGLLAKKL